MRILVLLLFLCDICGAQNTPTASIRRLDGSKISTSKADSFARKTLEATHVTGAEIAVLNNGRLVWSAGYGLRCKNPDQPMGPDTSIWAASITKSVFSTYVMLLVQRGEFNLDEPIARQLPKPLAQYEPYHDSASDLVRDPQWQLVTPRMLLSHTSGLANFAFIEPDKKMHLHFKPGTQFLYSGEGINVVQFVIEQKQGKSLDQLMQEAIFGPLGMTHTGLIYRSDFEANIADRFDTQGNFRSKTRRFPARAAGSMTTSSDDLAKFTTALLAGRIIQKPAQTEMLSPVFYIHTRHEFRLPDETDAGPDTKEADSVGLAYGIGWGLLTKTKFGPAFFKEGHGDGAQNYMICFERQKSCMIVLTNSDNGELAFRSLFETILGDTVTPWEWEGYTPEYIEQARKQP
ncbi:MAG TPA: serine hydrolase domain-containing protein [Silvibacterium sp.]|nr:serine hydrolase domain-containing protein [Silvibacterium sp.]